MPLKILVGAKDHNSVCQSVIDQDERTTVSCRRVLLAEPNPAVLPGEAVCSALCVSVENAQQQSVEQRQWHGQLEYG